MNAASASFCSEVRPELSILSPGLRNRSSISSKDFPLVSGNANRSQPRPDRATVPYNQNAPTNIVPSIVQSFCVIEYSIVNNDYQAVALTVSSQNSRTANRQESCTDYKIPDPVCRLNKSPVSITQ